MTSPTASRSTSPTTLTNAESLLWAYQLKRENAHLLARLRSLEDAYSAQQDSNLTIEALEPLQIRLANLETNHLKTHEVNRVAVDKLNEKIQVSQKATEQIREGITAGKTKVRVLENTLNEFGNRIQALETKLENLATGHCEEKLVLQRLAREAIGAQGYISSHVEAARRFDRLESQLAAFEDRLRNMMQAHQQTHSAAERAALVRHPVNSESDASQRVFPRLADIDRFEDVRESSHAPLLPPRYGRLRGQSQEAAQEKNHQKDHTFSINGDHQGPTILQSQERESTSEQTQQSNLQLPSSPPAQLGQAEQPRPTRIVRLRLIARGQVQGSSQATTVSDLSLSQVEKLPSARPSVETGPHLLAARDLNDGVLRKRPRTPPQHFEPPREEPPASPRKRLAKRPCVNPKAAQVPMASAPTTRQTRSQARAAAAAASAAATAVVTPEEMAIEIGTNIDRTSNNQQQISTIVNARADEKTLRATKSDQKRTHRSAAKDKKRLAAKKRQR